MLFTSLVFFAFLPIVFAGYWLLYYKRPNDIESPIRLWLQNLFVVIASYVFYGWWNWKFLILIVFTSVWAYFSGVILDRTTSTSKRKLIVALALVVNLGILGYFKYYNFFLDSAVGLLSAMGVDAHPDSLKIILPVGISFYTFQALSYVIDVYRRDIAATKDVVAFLAFVSFFPQLVAGPIERATNLLPQFLKARHFDYPLAVDGCRQMLWGFFKKMVVADGCALAANKILSAECNSSVSLAVGMICFSMQIYGDFSGYSDIAIGLSKTFGIRLKRNFSVPYFSRSIGEFWRRWHISLTTWFKDYLYIPMGGSREGLKKTIRNTFVVFMVSGLWHGASWTFVVWGFVHAVAFLPSLLMESNRRNVGSVVAEGRLLPSIGEAVGMTSTYLVVVFGWIFFRADSITQALQWVQNIMFSFDFSIAPLAHMGVPCAALWSFVMLVVEWFGRTKEYGLAYYPQNLFLRMVVYIAILMIIFMNLSPRQAFIYFQF